MRKVYKNVLKYFGNLIEKYIKNTLHKHIQCLGIKLWQCKERPWVLGCTDAYDSECALSGTGKVAYERLKSICSSLLYLKINDCWTWEIAQGLGGGLQDQ